jgi:hypothetical protein
MAQRPALPRIIVWAVSLGLATTVVAQDMTGGMVTDPPAPVSHGVATFTATYENLGPGPAADINVNVLIPIQPQTWPPESDGFLAMLESTAGSDSNGNDVFWSFDSTALCNYYMLQLQEPNPTGNHFTIPNPFPAGHDGAFSWELPIIPMEGINAGRLAITEPESLRNSFSVNGAQWVTYPWLHMFAGLYNLVATGALCDEVVAGCADLDACIGDRLWATEPFEAELEIGAGDNVGWPPETDPALGCGIGLVGFTAGRIALLRRGTCTFVEKFLNAQAAAAAGVILVNDGRCSEVPGADPDECTITMGGDPGTGYLVDVPSVLMSRRQGEELIAALQGGQTVRARMGNVPADNLDLFNWILSDADDPDLTNDYLVTRVPIALYLFSDSFESGDTSGWSAMVP